MQHSEFERLHTWPIAHHRQLLTPVCVHRDEVLGVSVQHQPPAGKWTNSSNQQSADDMICKEKE